MAMAVTKYLFLGLAFASYGLGKAMSLFFRHF